MRSAAALASVALAAACAAPRHAPTPLDAYVAACDPATSWQVVREEAHEGWTAITVRLVSQTWRSSGEVDRTEWTHWLEIARPTEVRHDVALLLIGGGRNRVEPPERANMIAGMIATRTGAVAVHLPAVPNEPLRFAGENRERSEDAILAYSFRRFLETGDPTWPALLPMVKSAARAMDAVQDILARNGVRIRGFVVTGGSKRGWTTWLIAAADRRVVAIAPAVIDVLNIRPSMAHHFSCYGFWAPTLDDYVEQQFERWFDTPEGERLLRIVDPYAYRDRFTMPKYVVNGCGDEFFVCDSWRFYWDDLPGPKLLRYVPNAGHGLNESAYLSIVAFAQRILDGRPLPEVRWKRQGDTLHVEPGGERPACVRLWTAANPDARDFRTVSGVRWSSEDLDPSQPQWSVALRPPERGWNSYLVELNFGEGPDALVATSGVYVVPDTLPFEPPPPLRTGD